MTDYVLYYWPLPFRGQFVRAVLAHADKAWEEPDADVVGNLVAAGPASQPMPFKGPPLLLDRATGEAMAQMPAILAWLGLRHGLLPDSAVGKAAALKVTMDCNDVIDEMTRQGGLVMWDEESWAGYQSDRLPRWLALFETTGCGYGMSADTGYLLGTATPSIADLAVTVCWGTMVDRLPPLRAILEDTAPVLAGLIRRIEALPDQAALIERTKERFGTSWCGGKIEASLRGVLGI